MKLMRPKHKDWQGYLLPGSIAISRTVEAMIKNLRARFNFNFWSPFLINPIHCFLLRNIYFVDIWWFMMIWYEDNWQDSKFIPVTVHIPLTRLRADNPQLQEKILNTWKSQWFPDVRFPKTSQIAHGFMVLPLSHALWSTEALPQAASRSRRPRIQQLDGFTEHPMKILWKFPMKILWKSYENPMKILWKWMIPIQLDRYFIKETSISAPSKILCTTSLTYCAIFKHSNALEVSDLMSDRSAEFGIFKSSCIYMYI